MDSAKVNIAPPMAQATWYRLVGVALGNATELYPHGDNVQTVEMWIPPQVWTGMDVALQNHILDEIDAGLPNGSRYSDMASAKARAAWKVVTAFAPKKTEHDAREIIKAWVKSGVLVSELPRTTWRNFRCCAASVSRCWSITTLRESKQPMIVGGHGRQLGAMFDVCAHPARGRTSMT